MAGDDMIRHFPPNFRSYAKDNRLLCQSGNFRAGYVFSGPGGGPRKPPLAPPPPFSERSNGTLIGLPVPELTKKIKSYLETIVVFWPQTHFLIQFWKVIEIGGKRLLTTQQQPFGFNKIDQGLCSYRLKSVGYEFDVDGVSEEQLGLLVRVFHHQQRESTPNVQYYSCNEYPQRDCAINCNIKQSLAVPLFEPSGRCCIGVFEMVSTNRKFWIFSYIESSLRVEGLTTSKCTHLCNEKDKDETLKEIKKMLEVVCSTHHLPLAQIWVLCRLCNALFTNDRTYVREGPKLTFLNVCASQHLRKGQGVVGRAVSSQNLVFCKDVTQFSITEYPLAHYARKFRITGSFAICLRSRYIEDNVYVLEFSLPPNYTEGGDLRIALVPLLTTMKQHCNSFKVASGEELGEKLSIEVLDFSEDGKLYSYQISPTARSPSRMESGEEMVFLDSSDQQLLEVDAVDTRNNVVSNTEENNIVVTSVQQNCITNSPQMLQRKAEIEISAEDLRQCFGMKLEEVCKSLGVSRHKVLYLCWKFGLPWWPIFKRKGNHLVSNKLVQGAVQEQIQKPSQPPISYPPRKQDMATASRTKLHFMAEQYTSTVTIKAKYGDDFIKFHLPVSSGMVEFQQEVTKRLNLQGGTYHVKYQDEDNDWILIVCNEDLQNYIYNLISRGRNTGTLSLQAITNCPP